MQGYSDTVVVEPFEEPKDNTEFSVTVLGTDKGPVALLPSEVTWFDLDDEVEEDKWDEDAKAARKYVSL